MKQIKLLSILLILSFSLKGQLNVSGGAGMASFGESISIAGQFEAGLKQPYNDCGGSGGGLMVAGGFIAIVDAKSPTTFYLKGGKAFRIGYGQELEVSAGYSWRLISFDDKSRNSTSPIYSLSLVNQVSDIGQWVINISGGKSFISGSIGMRINFIKY